MPRVFNVSLASDFSETVVDFLIERYNRNLPDLSGVFIILPSYNAVLLLREAFLRHHVIAPKIIALPSVNEEAVFVESGGSFREFFGAIEISEAKRKLEVVKICLEALGGFSVRSIFAFADDFIELESAISLGKGSIGELVEIFEAKFHGMSEKWRRSLDLFVEVYSRWCELKAANNWCVRLEKNAYYTRCLLDILRLKNADIYAVGMAGTTPEQATFVKGVLALERGFFICSGAENLSDDIKAPSCGILADILGNFEVRNIGSEVSVLRTERMYANSLEQVEQIVCKIRHLYNGFLSVDGSKKPSICVVAYNSRTGTFLAESLRKWGVFVEDSFGKSMQQNAHFRLFCGFIGFSGELDFCMDFFKNPLILPEEKLDIYAEEVGLRKSVNYKSGDVFKILKMEKKYDNFGGFLEQNLADFQRFLNKRDGEFELFIGNIRSEVGDFAASDEVYLMMLEDLAKAHRFGQKSALEPDVRVLSPAEARLFRFDYLFITDVNEGFVPSGDVKNRIVNGYFQEALGLKKCAHDIDWYDFMCLMNAGREVFVSHVKREFEGGELEPSNFLLHARLWADFMGKNEVYVRKNAIDKPFVLPNPPFKLEDLPKTIYVTQIATLMKNPYDFYVSRVLGLDVLEAVKTELLPGDMGEIMHFAIFELFSGRSFKGAIEMRLERFKKGFLMDFYMDSIASLEVFFRREYEEFLRALPLKSYIEEKMECELANLPFRLACRPDRVEVYESSAKIIDYKVKSSKISERDVMRGAEPQLMLEALIVNTLFPAVSLGNIECFYYYIDIKKGAVLRQAVQVVDVKKSLELLFFGLKNYSYNEEAEYHKYRILARFDGV